MRAIRVGSLCSLMVGVMATAMVSAAAAAPPEMGRCVTHAGGKYTNNVCTKKATKTTGPGSFEWEPGAVKNKFTGVGGVGTLETISQAKITCKTEASRGEFTSPKTVGNVDVTFTKCESAGYKCTSAGAAEGEIVTNPLSGNLVWEKWKSKVAIDLVPQSAELFVEFECGPANAKVKGSVMTNIPANVVKTIFEEKFKAEKGKQKPEYYYTGATEKVQDVLSSKVGGPGVEYEQSGQTITNTQTDEEALEVNTKV